MFDNKIEKSGSANAEKGITKYNKAKGLGAAAAVAAIGLQAAQIAAHANKAASEAAIKTIGVIQKNAGFVADKGSTGAKFAGKAIMTGVGQVAKGGSNAVKFASKHPKGTAAVIGTVGAAVAAGVVVKNVTSHSSSASDSLGKTQGGKTKIVNAQDKDGNDVRILEVDGVYQSATYTAEDKRCDLPFETYRTFDVVFTDGLPSKRLLMIGGGGFTFPKHVLAHHQDTSIDVLEPDSSIVKIAREQFFLSDVIAEFDPKGKRIHIIGKDGEGFLKFHAGIVRQSGDQDFKETILRKVKGANEPEALTYDSIINDAFSGKNACAELLLYGPLSDAKTCLNENGLYVLNVADAGPDDEQLKLCLEELGRVFRYVHVIPCPDENFGGENAAVLIATDGEYAFDGETQVQKTDPETLDALEEFESQLDEPDANEDAGSSDEEIGDQEIAGKTIVSDDVMTAMQNGGQMPEAKTSKNPLKRLLKR